MEKRKNQIEEYLKYIIHHKYLKINPLFHIFLCEELEPYKHELLKNKKMLDPKHFYEFLKSIKKNYLPKTINRMITPAKYLNFLIL